MRFIVSVFLILILVSSPTIANFTAYGHYDPPAEKAEKNLIIIKNVQLFKPKEKRNVTIQELFQDNDITRIFLHASIKSEKHIGMGDDRENANISIIKKSQYRSLTKETNAQSNEEDHDLSIPLPYPLEGKKINIIKHSKTFTYLTPSLEENKVNQKIWEHVDCVEPEPITLDLTLLNPGNKPLQGATGLIKKLDWLSGKIDYVNVVSGALDLPLLPSADVPWIAMKLADVADWLNGDVLLGMGHEENVGPGTYKTEIIFPLTEDEKSIYDSRLKEFGQDQANEYLKSVLKIAGVVTWSYDVSDLKNDSGCKPKIPHLEIQNSTKSVKVDKDDKEKIKKKPKYLPQKKSLKKVIDTKTDNTKKSTQTQLEVNSLKRTKQNRDQMFNTTENVLKKYTESPTSVLRGNDDGKVSSNTKPTLSIPKQVTQEATGPSGANVSFSTSGQDKEDGSLTPTCTPPPGSVFQIGATLVSCTVTDSQNNSISGSFTVTVHDTTPPTIDPIKPSEGARDDSGVVVFYEVTAHDLVDGNVPTQCNYPSGYKFPIGVTVLTCTADDSHGNHGSRSLQITITKKESPQ